jgi:NAD(P)-dependent dehydrogenase (short-subunit alcohol dehydrogenase family)
MSPRPFQDRIAVVTGAAAGIGFAVAQRFAEEGATVALLDQNEKEGRQALARISALSGDSEFYSVDVGVEAEMRETMASIAGRFRKVDHLVNNAGIVMMKTVEESSAEDWDRVMDVNVKSMFLAVKYLLPALRLSAQATIVNMGSVSGLVAQRGTPAYVAAKGAIVMLSKALALDLAEDSIRVNCVCPGITDTPMLRLHASATADPDRTLKARCERVPLTRMLSPREIADAVLYLSGDRSSGITGTSLVVDGGYTAAAEWSRASEKAPNIK